MLQKSRVVLNLFCNTRNLVQRSVRLYTLKNCVLQLQEVIVLVTVLGVLGMLLGVILFLIWRKSTKAWQRVLAWIAGICAAFSILFYITIYFSLNFNASKTVTSILVKPTDALAHATRIKMQTPPTDVSISAQIRGYSINVRRGPGTQYDIVGKIPAGAQVIVTGRNQDSSWVWVASDSVTGWASFDLIYFPSDVAKLPIIASNGEHPITTQAAENLPTPIPTQISGTNPTKVQTNINPMTGIPYCKDTGNLIGKFVSCIIPRAYCSYEPATNRNPTFCNDAPSPNYAFTLVVWGQDWSDYDGKCIVIYGYVTSFNGKPLIEGNIRSQVSICQ
jgi:Bacterial SH3 domain